MKVIQKRRYLTFIFKCLIIYHPAIFIIMTPVVICEKILKKQPPNYNKIAVNVMCVVLENVGGQGLIDEAIGAKSERCNSGGPSISASCIVM